MPLTRRRWMAATGVAAAAAALPAPSSALPPPAPALPPALKPEVFRERQAKLRAAAKPRLDALRTPRPTSLTREPATAQRRLTALLHCAARRSDHAVLEADNHRRDALVARLPGKERKKALHARNARQGPDLDRGDAVLRNASKLLSDRAPGRDATTLRRVRRSRR